MIRPRQFSPDQPPTARDVATALGVLAFLGTLRDTATGRAGVPIGPTATPYYGAVRALQDLAPYLSMQTPPSRPHGRRRRR